MRFGNLVLQSRKSRHEIGLRHHYEFALHQFEQEIDRILIIDDDVDFVRLLVRLLNQSVERYQVTYASSGREGLALANQFKPDLVFLDIGLPGMNGYEVARRLRDEVGMKTIKLIALSGYGSEKDQILSKEAGFDRHLVKPVDPSALPTIIATTFSEN